MSFLFSLIASLITSLLVLVYIQLFLDHNIKAKELSVTFVVGILGALFVAFITGIIIVTLATQYNFSKPFLFSVLWTLLGIAIPQVSFKILLIKKFCICRKTFKYLINAIIYGVIISLSFGAIDYFFYMSNIGVFASFYGIGSVLCHAMIGVMIGYHLA